MDIEKLKGLPILKAHFKKLADVSKAAFANLNLPSSTVGIVYWKEEDSWVVAGYEGDFLRVIKSETKDRGYTIDVLYFADKYEAKNYNDSFGDLLHTALEVYANPENKTGKYIAGKYVIELDMNVDLVYFLMENNAWQEELTKEEFDSLWEYEIQAINIPEGTTTIEEKAFANYSNLTSIVIPNSVTIIGNQAFLGCTGLTSIVIPNSVTIIDEYAFEGCTGLTSIVIPDSVTIIGMKAFEGCTGLTSIVIGNSVTEIGWHAFEGCTGLTSIVISEGNKVYDSRDNCNAIIETESNKLIFGCINTFIPDSVTEIESCAFQGCTGLTAIDIPPSVVSLNGFSYCTGLTSIDIPYSVTEIGYRAFEGCTGLTDIFVPKSVKTIEWGAFYECTSLASVTIEGPVEKIEESAFYKCTGLKTLTLAAGIKKISKKAFEGCTAIERINVPAKKADYYKKRLPENLHSLIVELP